MKAGQAAIWRIKSGFMQEVMASLSLVGWVGKAEMKDNEEGFVPLTLGLARTGKTREPMQLPHSHSKGQRRRKLAHAAQEVWAGGHDWEGQRGRAEGRSRQNGDASVQIGRSKYKADREVGENANT